MNENVNFKINGHQAISARVLNEGLSSFADACLFIKNLPYGRNTNKTNLELVFDENKGTCSTKHALLKQLANENNADNIKLMLGVFKMSKQNTPKVAKTLEQYGLDYIPEAHNYLKVNDEIIDCTASNSSKDDFINDLLLEVEIQIDQISAYKIDFHKAFLKRWLAEQPQVFLSLEELWSVREKCIRDLSAH